MIFAVWSEVSAAFRWGVCNISPELQACRVSRSSSFTQEKDVAAAWGRDEEEFTPGPLWSRCLSGQSAPRGSWGCDWQLNRTQSSAGKLGLIVFLKKGCGQKRWRAAAAWTILSVLVCSVADRLNRDCLITSSSSAASEKLCSQIVSPWMNKGVKCRRTQPVMIKPYFGLCEASWIHGNQGRIWENTKMIICDFHRLINVHSSDHLMETLSIGFMRQWHGNAQCRCIETTLNGFPVSVIVVI